MKKWKQDEFTDRFFEQWLFVTLGCTFLLTENWTGETNPNQNWLIKFLNPNSIILSPIKLLSTYKYFSSSIFLGSNISVWIKCYIFCLLYFKLNILFNSRSAFTVQLLDQIDCLIKIFQHSKYHIYVILDDRCGLRWLYYRNVPINFDIWINKMGQERTSNWNF